MKKFLQEFKDFAMRGNVMDLAVGVIIGAAFQGIVKSLVDDIISPILGLFGKINLSDLAFTIGNVNLRYGSFLTAVINFGIMAFVIFLIVKMLNKLSTIGKKKVKEAPTTKKCPFCFSEIPLEATRCPECTSMLLSEETEVEDAEVATKAEAALTTGME